MPACLRNPRVTLLLLLPVTALAEYPDSRRKQSEVDALLQKLPPAPGQVAVTVSSSIRGWRSMQEDLDPTPVIARGTAGTTMNDLVFYLDELVLRHRPGGRRHLSGRRRRRSGISQEAI
ncbi:MAG: hypothetical protein R3F54_22085 [Alphaproteobacteria bacterium]